MTTVIEVQIVNGQRKISVRPIDETTLTNTKEKGFLKENTSSMKKTWKIKVSSFQKIVIPLFVKCEGKNLKIFPLNLGAFQWASFSLSRYFLSLIITHSLSLLFSLSSSSKRSLSVNFIISYISTVNSSIIIKSF